MHSNGIICAVLAVGAVLVAGSPCLGADLHLACRVHWSRPGGRHRDGMRRLDIDLAAKTVRTSDDLGGGYRFKSQHGLVSVDRNRIVLAAGDGKTGYVDRKTSQYYFKNAREGVIIRGPCAKAGTAK